MTRLTYPAVAPASPCPSSLAANSGDVAALPKAGFYSCASGRFFVSKTGLVLELLDEDLDGPDEVLVALLPPDAEPMATLFLLPSLVLRIAMRLGLDVPALLRAAAAVDLLDELHWRGDGGWAPVDREDLSTLTTLVTANFVALAGEHARVGDGAVEVLDRLTRAMAELGNILRPVLGIAAGLPRPERERIARELCRRGELWITTHDGVVHVFGRPGSSADLLLADERPPLGHERTP